MGTDPPASPRPMPGRKEKPAHFTLDFASPPPDVPVRPDERGTPQLPLRPVRGDAATRWLEADGISETLHVRTRKCGVFAAEYLFGRFRTMTNPTTKMSVDIASPPDREKLVAQILFDRKQWAEIHQDSGSLTLELYPREDGKPWQFSFDEALTALRHAQKRLTGDDTPTA